jgi:N-acetylglutamate synthase-like GNAT family acetyltransferase
MHVTIRETNNNDMKWIRSIFMDYWGAPAVVSNGKLHNYDELRGLVAIKAPLNNGSDSREADEGRCGLLTYLIEHEACEIVTLNSFREKSGIGTILIKSVIKKVLAARCRRLWLVTTNDNKHAIEFYQKRGFALIQIRKNIMTKYRKLKPEIPIFGENGILITDELVFEMPLMAPNR